MACGDNDQFRIAEYHKWGFSSDGEANEQLPLTSAIDVARYSTLTYTVTVFWASLNGGAVDIIFPSAPVNEEIYYGEGDQSSPPSITVTGAIASPTAYQITIERKFSRFILPQLSISGTGGSGGEIVATIDMLARV